KSEFARRFLSKAKSMEPGAGCVWLAYGHSFAHDNEHDQAMAAYFKASQLMGGCHLPPLYVGVECSQLNNSAMCERFMARAAAMHANVETGADKSPERESEGGWMRLVGTVQEPHVAHEAGVAAFNAGDHIAAYELFTRALDIARGDRDISQLSSRWGATLDALGHAARRLDPDHVCALQLLDALVDCAPSYCTGHAARRLGHVVEACGWHARALVARPQRAHSLAARALALALRGPAAAPAAAQALHAALAIDPDHVCALQLLDALVDCAPSYCTGVCVVMVVIRRVRARGAAARSRGGGVRGWHARALVARPQRAHSLAARALALALRGPAAAPAAAQALHAALAIDPDHVCALQLLDALVDCAPSYCTDPDHVCALQLLDALVDCAPSYCTGIKLRDPTAWLYSCCEECTVRIFCYHDTAMTALSGNGIISLGQGCSLKTNSYTIYAHKNLMHHMKTQTNLLLTPKLSLLNNVINTSISENFTELENHDEMWNQVREQINNLKDQSQRSDNNLSIHDVHHYSISYFMLLLLLILCCIIVFLVIKFKRRATNMSVEVLPMTHLSSEQQTNAAATEDEDASRTTQSRTTGASRSRRRSTGSFVSMRDTNYISKPIKATSVNKGTSPMVSSRSVNVKLSEEK
ncbi:hypothetical protein ACJJTC_012573, partial [Scirpophaga incertulas]